MAWVVNSNAADLEKEGGAFLPRDPCETLTRLAREALERHRVQLDNRRDAGFVRRCHGDLHLRNIVLLNGVPTLFDGIEFNDQIACIDVLYDLAFLLMDLWRRGLIRHANVIWNDYLDETQDFAGASLMPLFLSCRAAVRAKTSATAANLERDPSRNAELQAGAQQYLRLAVELLRPSAACLVGTGGLSGSGKSTLAAALAPLLGPAPGAVVIRSDAVRKRLCGVVPTTRLGPEGYSPGVSEAVYETLAERAELVTRAGHAAIADAVYASVTDRIAIERRADEAATCFVGLWLEAPTEMLVERATGRGPDPSDADAAVVEAQGRRDLGEMRWERIDATSGPNEVLKAAMAVVGSRTGTAVRVTASGGADG